MKKRFIMLVAAFSAALTLGLCACDFEGDSAKGDTGEETGGSVSENDSLNEDNGEEQEHVHTYGEEWKNNFEYHWHAPNCGHNVEISDKAEHTFLDGVCVVCNFEKFTEALTFALNDDKASYSVTGVVKTDEKDIEIPSVYRNLPVTKISANAFRNCESIKTVHIPYGIATIGECAFFGCKAVTEIELPESVKAIRSCAFMDCESLIHITVPDSVTVLEYSAFDNTAYSNDVINWTNGVLYLGNHLLHASNSISGIFTVRENTLTVSGLAFKGCDKITSIAIPNSVRYIGELAFMNCYSLKTVTLSDNLEYLCSMAFYGTAVKELTLPSSIKHIGDFALISCNTLEKINFLGTEEKWNTIYTKPDWIKNNFEIAFVEN